MSLTLRAVADEVRSEGSWRRKRAASGGSVTVARGRRGEVGWACRGERDAWCMVVCTEGMRQAYICSAFGIGWEIVCMLKAI